MRATVRKYRAAKSNESIPVALRTPARTPAVTNEYMFESRTKSTNAVRGNLAFRYPAQIFAPNIYESDSHVRKDKYIMIATLETNSDSTNLVKTTTAKRNSNAVVTMNACISSYLPVIPSPQPHLIFSSTLKLFDRLQTCKLYVING